MKMFLSSDRPAWARVSSPARWPRRLAATGTRRCTLERPRCFAIWRWHAPTAACVCCWPSSAASICRSEEHTSELQSRENLVCRLLLEKKKKKEKNITTEKNKKKIQK